MRSAAYVLASLVMPYALAWSAQAPKNFDSISLERTACYGACPAYKVEIKSTGEVLFNGKSDVAAKGERKGKVTSSDIEFLRAALERATFYELRDSYANEADGCKEVWTDNPSLAISVASGSSAKSVTYYFGCRGPLILSTISWLADTIDVVAGTSRWVGAKLLKDN